MVSLSASSLETVIQAELDNSGIDTGASYLPEGSVPKLDSGIPELWMVESIVKLGPELDRMAFS
jgi:hypothetical protein